MQTQFLDIETINGNNGLLIHGIIPNDFLGYASGSYSISDVGDINGDGLDDAVIGVYLGYANLAPSGEAYVIYGNQALNRQVERNLFSFQNQDGIRIQSFDYGYTGIRIVEGGGDLNGDGFDDLVVADSDYGQFDDENSYDRGRVYVILGGDEVGKSQPINLLDLPSETSAIVEGENGNQLGGAVDILGDINGDGFDDLIVTETGFYNDVAPKFPHDDVGYVLFGTPDLASNGFADPDTLDGQFGFKFDLPELDPSHINVKTLGDINRDGLDDFAIATPDVDNLGTTYVIFGDQNIGRDGELRLTNMLQGEGLRIRGQAETDLSFQIEQAGDINGDGIHDIILGSRQAGKYGEGYIIFGSEQIHESTLFDLSDLDGENGFVLHADASIGGELSTFTSAGDFNGDGIDDIAIGAPLSELESGNSGVVFIIYGDETIGNTGIVNVGQLEREAGFSIRGSQFDFLGRHITSIGDINHDNLDDLLLTGRGGDSQPLTSGRNYIIFGSEQYFNDQVISGSNEDERIKGGDGNDTLFGLAGQDTLVGSMGNDRLIGGTQNDVLRGGPGQDFLRGGLGHDRIIGGPGVDTLQGGMGQDKFVFQRAQQGTDRILDFDVAVDQILIQQAGFDIDVAKGGLAKERFVMGSAARDKSDRMIYNPQTGSLLYDADGSRSGKAITIAVLDQNLALSANHIRVI